MCTLLGVCLPFDLYLWVYVLAGWGLDFDVLGLGGFGFCCGWVLIGFSFYAFYFVCCLPVCLRFGVLLITFCVLRSRFSIWVYLKTRCFGLSEFQDFCYLMILWVGAYVGVLGFSWVLVVLLLFSCWVGLHFVFCGVSPFEVALVRYFLISGFDLRVCVFWLGLHWMTWCRFAICDFCSVDAG